MDPETQRAEAERWLGIAAKLMAARDLIGSKTFAIRARDADPNNGVSEQILAVVDTVLAGEKRVNASQQPDWYSILQLPKLVRDPDLIADHYRRLVFCLNPERNSFPYADYALQLVMDAWSVLSDPTKKWLFDNELALYLQQHHQHEQPQQQQQQQPQQPQHQAHNQNQGQNQSQSQPQQLNTFQFFQPQPQQLSQQQPQAQPQPQQQQPMWQQQIGQREFMAQVTHQQVPPQWQMRDPTPNKAGGGGGGGGGGVRGVTQATPMIPAQNTPVRAVPLPVQTPVSVGRVTVAATTTVVDGNVGNVSAASRVNAAPAASSVNAATAASRVNAAPAASSVNAAPAASVNFNVNDNINNSSNNDVNVNVDVNGNVAVEEVEEEEEEEDGVVEEVESFWTACPYCLYIFEYQKVYQGCALRCQNCRKVFHAVQIPNPPPICSNNGGGGGGKKEKEKAKGKESEKDKDKEKGNENSFCCWGFFPLGFSMTAWKKHNQAGSLNASSNWVPFSPMFANPVANRGGGGGGFQWFNNNDDNACGPKHDVAKSTPRVYIDDDDAFLDLSESSDLDSSDGDWRTYNQEKTKKKKKIRRGNRRGNVGGRKRGRIGRPPKSDVVKQVNPNVASGGGVSVGGENLEVGSNGQEIVFSLAAGDKTNSSKNVPATHVRKQTRRSVKDVGRLDLNVEFNNDGEEHAPTVSAVNGEEDGIENIAFFDGLDEFLSTLPILNVGGDEKAKPS
ncbi:DnaJ-like protein subfamily B member 12 [Bienertia sinuspersici]